MSEEEEEFFDHKLSKEELDEKIARIRKQNAAIIERQMMIQAEIEDCQKKNAIVNLKPQASEENDEEGFGPTLYSDKLSQEKRVVKPTPEDIWDQKPAPRRNIHRGDKEEEWREERKRIDEERIRRQKANTGSWKREWDANKVPLGEGHDDATSSRNTDDKRFWNEKPENRKNFYSNESKGNFYQDSDSTENETQNRWKSDRPNHRIDPVRRTNDYCDDRSSDRTSNWGTNTSESDNFNNNATKPDLRNRIVNSSNSNKSSFVSNTEQPQTENWGLDCKTRASEPIKPKVNDWRAPSGDNPRTDACKKSQTNEWRAPSGSNLRTSEYNKPQMNEWRSAPGANQKTNEHNKPLITERCGPPTDNLKTNDSNKLQTNEWRGSSGSNVRTMESNKPPATEWRNPSRDIKATQSNKPQTNEWRTSVDARPVAVRGIKWNRPSDIPVKNMPSLNLINRLNRYNQSRNENLDFEQSTTIPLPDDLKNIVIHVKSSGTESDKRKVEVLNTTRITEPTCLNPNQSLDDTRDFGAYVNSSGYGTITFERSDLKRSTEHPHFEDLSSQTAIVTQMFSNSSISDNLSNKTGSMGQIYENSNNEPQFLTNQFFNHQQLPSLQEIVDSAKKSQDVEVIRTINERNLVFTQQPNLVNNARPKKSQYVKSKNEVTKKESEQVELGEDEWQDGSDDEWEDVSDGEEE